MTGLRKIVLGAGLVLTCLPALATAHGEFGARAGRPSFNPSTLRLSAAGGYGTSRRHTAVRVTVCLEKSYRGTFFTVKCKTSQDGDRRVRARVRVAGCVRGVWRSTATGEAQGRGGEWKHPASAVSETYRCR